MNSTTAARRRVTGTRTRYATTLDEVTDGPRRRTGRPVPRRQRTRRAATLAAIREARA